MDLKAAEHAILGAWVSGIVAGGLALIKSVISLVMAGPDLRWLAILGLTDPIILFALTYGVSEKRRVCAILLCSYFVIGSIAIWIQSGKPVGLIVTAFLSYFFFQGIRGAFAYQRIR